MKVRITHYRLRQAKELLRQNDSQSLIVIVLILPRDDYRDRDS